jgi:hypothetical protein
MQVMDQRRFNKLLSQSSRTLALVLVVPVTASGMLGNPLAFLAALGLLRIANQSAKPLLSRPPYRA